MERTLVMIKPDNVDEADTILQELDELGDRIETVHIDNLLRGVMEDHYAIYKGEWHYQHVIDSFTGRQVVVAVYEGESVIRRIKDAIGPTDPTSEGSKDTIRARHYKSSARHIRLKEGTIFPNVIHVSDSLEEAQREIRVWERYLNLST